jgi:hypothetical protein
MNVEGSEVRLVAGGGCAKCMAARSKDPHFACFQQKHGKGREPNSMRMRL